MTDVRLEQARRAWNTSGSVEDEAALLRERVRAGELSAREVALAAHYGHPAAELARGERGPVDVGPEYLLQEAYASALHLQTRFWRSGDPALLTETFQAVQARLDAPSEDAIARCAQLAATISPTTNDTGWKEWAIRRLAEAAAARTPERVASLAVEARGYVVTSGYRLEEPAIEQRMASLLLGVEHSPIRALERAWQRSGRLEDEVAYLRARLAAYDLLRPQLELAAFCGSPGALSMVGWEPPDASRWPVGFARWGRVVTLRAGVLALGHEGASAAERAVCEVADAWLEDPGPESARLAREWLRDEGARGASAELLHLVIQATPNLEASITKIVELSGQAASSLRTRVDSGMLRWVLGGHPWPEDYREPA